MEFIDMVAPNDSALRDQLIKMLDTLVPHFILVNMGIPESILKNNTVS